MLDIQDFKLYNNLIHTLYHTSNLNQMRVVALDKLIHLVPYDNAAFFLVAPGTEAFTEPLLYGLDRYSFQQYQAYYEERDEYKKAVFSQDIIPPVDRCSDYMDYQLWQKNEHRSDFLLPQGIYHMAGVQILQNDRLLGEISLHRKASSPDFSDREMYILQMLHSHINSVFTGLASTNSEYGLPDGEAAVSINPGPSDLLSDLTPESRATAASSNKSLTRRERDIVSLIAQGKTNQEIARQLYISENTVKTYIKRLFVKLGVKSRTELVFAIYFS